MSIFSRLRKLEAAMARGRLSVAEGSGLSISQSENGTVLSGRRSGWEDETAGFEPEEYNANTPYPQGKVVSYGSNQAATQQTILEAGVAAGLYISKIVVPQSSSVHHAPTGASSDTYWQQVLPISGPGIGFKAASQTNKVQIFCTHVPAAYGDVKLRKMDICLLNETSGLYEEHDAYVLMTQARRKLDDVMREPTASE